MLQITLNGKPQTIAPPSTLQTIVAQYCKNPQHVIAELNGAIINKNSWPSQTIQNGDTIELVSFVGGG